jgi:Family of unknown function (DUF6384)
MPDAPAIPAPAPAAATVAGGGKPASLDDLMLAMDVVDTLRHEQDLVSRELDEEGREAELVERLRTIYRNQGIEVPDNVIADGVKALKDSRFVYTPPKPGFGTTLARLWVERRRIGGWVGGVAAVLALAVFAYQAFVVAPQRRAAQAARTELGETLPKSLAQAYSEVVSEAKVDAAKMQADQILADGKAALGRGDAAGGRAAIEDLEALRANLRRSYQLLIVSRPGEQSGVFRIPNRNTGARNYYLIVEAIGPDGKAIPLPIKSEEDGTTKLVSKWGVRVSDAVFEAVRRDKQDDGIVQNKLVGEKRRGALDVDYAMPVQGGAITQW